jgi:hypothetical protein
MTLLGRDSLELTGYGFYFFGVIMDKVQGKEILFTLFITPSGYRLEFALNNISSLETALFLARDFIESTLGEG